MDDKSTITVYIRTLTGKSHALQVAPEVTIKSIKEQIAEISDPVVAQYKDFESFKTFLPSLIFAGKPLEDEKQLSEYNIKTESTLHEVIRMSSRSAEQKIVCVTDNLKFTTFLAHSKEETVESLKQKLEQFVGLSCTTLSLKRKDGSGYQELPNGTAIPLRDIHVRFIGSVEIRQSEKHPIFYQGEKGVYSAMPKETTEEERHQFDHNAIGFSNPTEIEKIENKQGEYFTHSKEQMLRKMMLNKAYAAFKAYSICAGSAALSIEGVQYLLSGTASDRTIASVFLTSFGVALVSGIAAAGYSYLQDVYAKRAAEEQEHKH